MARHANFQAFAREIIAQETVFAIKLMVFILFLKILFNYKKYFKKANVNASKAFQVKIAKKIAAKMLYAKMEHAIQQQVEFTNLIAPNAQIFIIY